MKQTNIHFYRIFLQWQKLDRKSKHPFCLQKLFFENRAFYEKICKTSVQRGGPQMTIWRMRIAC